MQHCRLTFVKAIFRRNFRSAASIFLRRDELLTVVIRRLNRQLVDKFYILNYSVQFANIENCSNHAFELAYHAAVVTVP
jgi:hypothetical protein